MMRWGTEEGIWGYNQISVSLKIPAITFDKFGFDNLQLNNS
jgi:hypothetical protein